MEEALGIHEKHFHDGETQSKTTLQHACKSRRYSTLCASASSCLQYRSRQGLQNLATPWGGWLTSTGRLPPAKIATPAQALSTTLHAKERRRKSMGVLPGLSVYVVGESGVFCYPSLPPATGGSHHSVTQEDSRGPAVSDQPSFLASLV